jgi:hypothetical protein
MAKSKQTGKKKKPGRPRGKPLSEKERAQRRAAPLIHGEYAATALAQALPPCKPAVCPLEAPAAPADGGGYPCKVKTTIEARGGGLSTCLMALGEEGTIRKFVDAITRGDTAGVAELAAMSLAAKSRLEHDGLSALLNEGLTFEEPIVGKGPDGPEIIGTRLKEHPAAALTLKLGEHLGRTATDQVVTPRARGENVRDEGIGQLGHLAWIQQMRIGLADREGE